MTTAAPETRDINGPTPNLKRVMGPKLLLQEGWHVEQRPGGNGQSSHGAAPRCRHSDQLYCRMHVCC